MGAEMDLAEDGGSRFEAYVDGLASVIGHKDREGPLRDYCLGLMLPCERKSVEPLAAVTAPARVAAASIAVAFRRRGRLVGRTRVGEGARDGIAGDRAAWRDLGLDHRRHELSEAGAAFGGGGAAVLRSARQAGQLPSGGVIVAGQSPCEPASSLAAVFAAGVGG